MSPFCDNPRVAPSHANRGRGPAMESKGKHSWRAQVASSWSLAPPYKLRWCDGQLRSQAPYRGAHHKHVYPHAIGCPSRGAALVAFIPCRMAVTTVVSSSRWAGNGRATIQTPGRQDEHNMHRLREKYKANRLPNMHTLGAVGWPDACSARVQHA
ncbi:hypothetical protein BDY17DRAFT_160295 [Neohortaea acidophila]|uniref:Uncharacterized protein n=1 Tax=Neohortaea acidophila TaxID=245834 RepID=A0A6A6PSI1_9PEZI|nr:uncharacterized protein BDY17DRAFT_160295 [Neohortaea acidophila]KAF2482453.1 hypothetical protein BDY17DRAFT_160295 [Neohortaea acidophila]